MHLKTLTLRGFKSFASATTLHFEPGINCVVGPNGSGKSNVVDALAWVMGEQGAKNLRGGNMADVIFAGTASRQALGRAEVSLTIDNTDGALPIDYSEVTISRTLFRAGGSEYAINGTACRLLDIQELLSDTGMGRQMHVIIGQGKLDQVLTATAEDRRSFIEEAAGVLKHRRRKEKALHKLQAMQVNLTRIEDLATELRRQLGPLARQASTARRAQAIQQHVFDARARLLADDVAQAQARLASHTTNEVVLAERRAEIDQSVTRARTAVDALEAELAQEMPKLEQLTDTWQRATSLTERFSSLRALALERQRSLTQVGPQIHRGESPESIRERAQAARKEEDELRGAVQQAHDNLTVVVANREKAESAEREVDAELSTLNRSIADRREARARLTGQLATVSSKLEALNAERERVVSAAGDAQRRAHEAAQQVAQLEQDVVAHTNGDDTLAIEHEEAAKDLAQAKEKREAARAALTSAQGQTVAWQTKAETLKLSLAPEDATAWALDTYRSGISGLVRDAIHIDSGWEAGIEAGLRGIAEGVVAGSIDHAIDALRAAREADAGHVELLVSGVKADGDDALAVVEKSGIAHNQARSAPSLIHGTDEVAHALRYALRDTIIAVDLATARELMHAGAQRVATLAGDLLTPATASGGEVEHSATLARQALYDDAVAQAHAAREHEAQARQEIEQAQAQVVQAQEYFDVLQSQLTSRDSHMAAVSAQLGVLRQTLAGAQSEEERYAQRIERIDADLRARRAEQEELVQREQRATTDPDNDGDILLQLTNKREEAHRTTVELRTSETEARLALRTAEERLRAIAGRAESLENMAQSVAGRIAQEERAAIRRAQAATVARSIYDYADQALIIAQRIVDTASAQRTDFQQAHLMRETELGLARKALDVALAEQRQLADTRHQHELVLAELTLTYRQLAERAIAEVGMEAETLIDEYGPHQLIEEIEPVADHTPKVDDRSGVTSDEDSDTPTVRRYPYVRAEQEKRLARAERDLVKLGKINPLALEEHAALEQRHTYLSEQLADLRQSRTDLLRIVADIDQRVHDVMAEAFTDVAREFSDIFARLFPGGEGRLVLSDPESILTTGIDIEARPPGKRVKRLSLLSGGERSLTAVAFLVAIFKARPSPFYVMDEVEAALDDVNLTRLLDIFNELKDNSQLLVITHHKRTMEIADALYGVAMREGGVTSVISQRLKDVSP
ncbi:chromosome segregation protein SMC [Arcanobacterium pinnipediorum]|uniref:Chromosome partition protein Smc n=1 Tax=Arcanobacterium pinnipediorum TaxID=1503041 RepID=A0ABY5AKG3_9ACTO|nr:chromosome segregation protein SMC [Arcanobacterium pinnipediorum]USR79921.1 chromosome segregation protein SMC [Arcanobacterium pinnipediorum]